MSLLNIQNEDSDSLFLTGNKRVVRYIALCPKCAHLIHKQH